jgi:hypothetical protein
MSHCRFCSQELEDADWSNGYCGVCGEELPDLDSHLIKISIPNEDDFLASVSAKVIMRLAENLGVSLHEDEGAILAYTDDWDTRNEFLKNVSECTPEATILV